MTPKGEPIRCKNGPEFTTRIGGRTVGHSNLITDAKLRINLSWSKEDAMLKTSLVVLRLASLVVHSWAKVILAKNNLTVYSLAKISLTVYSLAKISVAVLNLFSLTVLSLARLAVYNLVKISLAALSLTSLAAYSLVKYHPSGS